MRAKNWEEDDIIVYPNGSIVAQRNIRPGEDLKIFYQCT